MPSKGVQSGLPQAFCHTCLQGAAELLPGQKPGKAAAKGLKRQSFQREQRSSREPHDGSHETFGAVTAEGPAPVRTSAAKKQKQRSLQQNLKGAARHEEAAAEHSAALHSNQQPRKKSVKQKAAAGAPQSNAQQDTAAGREHAGSKKRTRPAREDKGAHEQTAEERARSRLASFAKPTLAGPSSSSSMQDRKRRKKEERADKAAAPSAAPEEPAGPKLTKAQKKNLWRAKRRALQQRSQPVA